ncbi:hypothetical protein GmHk_07G019160 [Glycine max]|nr:hypothetical protein GmHk_07G019160 [Glycine max]
MIALKIKIKSWSRETFDGLDGKIEELRCIRQKESMLLQKSKNGWIDNVGGVKDAVRNHFEEAYWEPELDRPNLDGIEFKCLDSMESESLVADFAYEEIKVVVWSCGNGKSSRPNGFNSNFFKECWSIVGKDYVDDSIIVGEESQDNLWALKAILKNYELVSGLKVNFHKSGIYGINIDGLFLQAVENFLYCNIGTLPLKFLGIPIGANARRCHTWEPIIAIFQKRLVGWRRKHLYMGGGVVMINFVLNNLPLYFFSFYRASRKVSWENICLLKQESGLGSKNLEKFNICLLAKWRWQFLTYRSMLWYKSLSYRYDNLQ